MKSAMRRLASEPAGWGSSVSRRRQSRACWGVGTARALASARAWSARDPGAKPLGPAVAGLGRGAAARRIATVAPRSQRRIIQMHLFWWRVLTGAGAETKLLQAWTGA